jgi:YD repeat-containing protein
VPVPGEQCQPEIPTGTGTTFRWEETIVSPALGASVCSATAFRCALPVHESTTYQFLDPGCDPLAGPCQYQARVQFRLPGNQLNQGDDPNAHLFNSRWYEGETAPTCYDFNCGQKSICGQAFTGGGVIDGDRAVFTATVSNTCSGVEDDDRVWSLAVQVCQTSFSCRKTGKAEGIVLGGPEVAAELGCPDPRMDECDDCAATIDGTVPKGGDAACLIPEDSGPGAHLRYTGRGAGHPGFPGTASWNVLLGRYWAHDYAVRVVEDPDESHVWLITEHGTFREFSGLVGGVYTAVSPSDEHRTLEWSGVGWILTDLDGTVTQFDTGGLWSSTTDRNGNATVGTYGGGLLDTVDFADGRSEQLGYDAGGRLSSITEVGVDGLTTRTWTYVWSGTDLTRIERPDGTAWVMTYSTDPDLAGYITLLELEGTDASRRVEQGWEYDAHGNVVRTWKGAPSFGDPDAVERWQLAFDDPLLPTVTTVTDPLGEVATYGIGRDDGSSKPRIESIDGDCPGCGLAPDTVFTYGDGAHPLRPTQMVDGNGNVTQWTYDARGRVLTRTEAAGTGVARTTTYAYDTTYPELVTEISVPSVAAGQDRLTLVGRDASGNVTSQEVRGWENGQPFDCTLGGGAPCYATATSYNAAGQPETIDPPGYGTDDVTAYTYDPARGSLVADSRTDPLIGTTTFGHDAFNRRTSVTDPNGVTTESEYDLLGRMTKAIQKGAVPAEDLVTEHVYDVFGDLRRTTLPAGNVIEYGYDDAGRLTSIERKPDFATPGERIVFELDNAGNRTREDLQGWVGSQWVTEATTSYLYTTRCRLDQVLHPDGSITEHAYDCNGNLARTWDANHPSAGQTAPPTTTYTYDPLDRLATVTQPWTGAGGGTSVTAYGYDVQDHLTSVEDAEGSVTGYQYSDRDLLTEEVSPVSGTTTHAYNAHGELIETTDARGITMLRSVDALDRVTVVDYSDASLDTTYTYDDPLVAFSLGRLTAITRDGQTVPYAYDRYGRTTQDGGFELRL